ncbi:hypothetical protein Psuf_046600 [Phytohabitans suffuscus]|uniref:Uncharacterized protein n=1 Tax=Phytohabitans suffuscus TaxID=624315 RepID=A0A6F8YMP5_9ACTN|nr:hypothetical protein [Phytohabitans suffuscus]BCB87347.1 hypothetical protein Psuf_046600 [Phytohabitans suffuscus]
MTTHVAASRRDEPGEQRTQIIPRQHHPGETHVMPAVRMPITPRATTMAQRHAGWLPRMWPLVAWFVGVLGVTLWLSVKSTGPLGVVVTIVWTYPVIGTVVGIVGALVTRRRLRRDRLTAADDQIIRCKDRLVVVVPTIGRHDTYPALDRVVHSYITYLPECFPKLRVDVVIEEGCEAAEKIYKLGEVSRYIRVVTVPRATTRSTARSSSRGPTTTPTSCASPSTKTATTSGCCTWTTTPASAWTRRSRWPASSSSSATSATRRVTWPRAS